MSVEHAVATAGVGPGGIFRLGTRAPGEASGRLGLALVAVGLVVTVVDPPD